MSNRAKKSGLGPESLVYVGSERKDHVSIHVMDYTNSDLTELSIEQLSDCSRYLKSESITWIDVDGIHDSNIVETLGKQFNIHMLVLEDVMNSQTRPKVEFFDEYMFISLKMIDYDVATKYQNLEQLSLIVGSNYIIAFQERPGDSFDNVRERIRKSKGKVRSKDARYLAYLLIDVIVDNYISISENYSDQIEELEKQVLRNANEFTLHRILKLRKELLSFKRSIDPLKEAVNTINKEYDDETGKYYRDLYDHIIYESENLAVYREMISNLLELYHSSLGFRTNNVMKVLTIITTIFVPLTFIVGVYGMNFDNMPELHWQNGYFMVMGIILIIVIFQLYYFRKRQWL